MGEWALGLLIHLGSFVGTIRYMRLNPKILIDPQFELTGKDRRLLMRRASNQWFKQPLNITLYIVFTFGWMGLMFFLPNQLKAMGLDPAAVSLINWLVIYPLMFVAFYYIFYHFRLMKHIYHELRALGHDVCGDCGYTLIELPESETRCPECGTDREALEAAGTVASIGRV